MKLTLGHLIETLKTHPEKTQFDQVIALISDLYEYTPTRFMNGIGPNMLINKAGANEGSCKIFAFAQDQNLDELETLACFGKYFQIDVLKHPDANDHGNIRTFMREGWAGIQFDQPPLRLKSTK